MNQKKKHRDFCIDKYKLNRLYYGTKSQKRRSSIVQKQKGNRACLNDQHGRKTTRVSIGTGKTNMWSWKTRSRRNPEKLRMNKRLSGYCLCVVMNYFEYTNTIPYFKKKFKLFCPKTLLLLFKYAVWLINYVNKARKWIVAVCHFQLFSHMLRRSQS